MKRFYSLFIILIVSVFSISIYFLTPIFIKHFSGLTHIVIEHYLLLLRHTILFLPIAVILYFIRPLRKSLDYEYINKIKTPYFLILIFSLSMLATNFISWHYFDHIPQGDATAVYSQAKIFRTGQRWSIAPVYPQFFDDRMVNNNGRWFAITPPGHSLILALGMLIGIPWIICPLLGSLSLIIFFFILNNLFDSKTAKVSTVFLLLSPFFLFVSSEFLNQNSSSFFILLSFLLVIKFIKSSVGTSRRGGTVSLHFLALLSGLCAGFAFFSRPAIALAFAILTIIYLYIQKTKKSYISLFILGFLVFLIIQLYDNFLLTGKPLQYGYSLYGIEKQNEIGFGAGKGYNTYNIFGHTPVKALINFIYNLFVFSLHLFGWPLLSIGFILIPFIKHTKNKTDIFAIGFICCSILFISFYWFHGVSPMGPKYYYEITPFLVFLTVRGIEKLKINVRPFITLLFLIGIFIYIPQAVKIFSAQGGSASGGNVWGNNNNCYNEVKKHNLHNAVVFIRTMEEKDEYTKCINRHSYPSVSFRNAVKLEDGDIIYARDLGKELNLKLKTLYADRKSYIFEYIDNGKSYHLIPDY